MDSRLPQLRLNWRLVDTLDDLWDYNDPQGSANRFRERSLAATDQEDLAETLTQLARAQGLQGLFEEAQATLERARPLLTEGPNRARTRWLLEQGRVLNSSGNAQDSLPVFHEAVTCAKESQEPGLEIDALHMLAIADAGQARRWNTIAIEKAEASDDPRARRWLASLYNNQGHQCLQEGQADEALALFQRAVPLREQAADPSNLRFAKWCVGRALRDLGRCQEALDTQLALAEEDPQDPYIRQEAALCLDSLGRTDEAVPHAKAALSRLAQDPWYTSNRPELFAALQRIAGEAKAKTVDLA